MRKSIRRRSRLLGAVLAAVVFAAGTTWSGFAPVAAGAAEDPLMCFGKPATIIGTAGDDTLTGTPDHDVIVGLEGTDTISTSGGIDRVCAGPNALSVDADGVPRYERITFAGDGLFDGGPGLDRIGSDRMHTAEIYGGSNPTVVDEGGRLWPERIVVRQASRPEIFGGDGPDRIDILPVPGAVDMRAKVDAGAGHDVVTCSQDITSVCDLYGGSGTGNDRLRVENPFTATLSGGGGNDVLSATRDSGSGSPGPYILRGGSGADKLVGLGPYAQVFSGGPGLDTIRAGGGSDRAWGGTGRDVLGGAGGRDSLYGGAGRDANYGGPGNDLCRSPQRGPRAHSCQR